MAIINPKFMSRKALTEVKEQSYDHMCRVQENLYMAELHKIFVWFREKFPNHTIEWLDGMGTQMWIIDGEIWDCETLVHAPIYRDGSYWGSSKYLTERGWTRKEVLLKPLVDFYGSITEGDFVAQHGIQLGHWGIDKVSREIVEMG